MKNKNPIIFLNMYKSAGKLPADLKKRGLVFKKQRNLNHFWNKLT